jgi:hypothetical protein
MARPQIEDGGDSLQIWRVAATILNKLRGQPTRGSSCACGLGRGITVKNQHVNKMLHRDFCEHGNEHSDSIKFG